MVSKFLKEIDINTKSGVIKRHIILYCLNKGNSTIPDIAKELEFSVPTITKYVTELCVGGYMRDYGKLETSEGRHPSVYGVNADFCYFLGIDIKKFEISFMLLNFAGEVKKFITSDSYTLDNSPEGLDKLCETIHEVVNSLNTSSELILSANINIPGRINTNTGHSFTLFNFEETPLAEILTKRLGFITTIENDTRAMTYGEYKIVYNEEIRNMLFINLSWGLGSGLILDGKAFTGKSGFAGEFGHQSFFNNEIMCQCGKKGCLETEVSGSALQRELISAIKLGASSALTEMVDSGETITMSDIIRAIEKEDPLTIELLEQMAQKLGRNIANLINLLNPERIVIGGTLSPAGDYLLEPLKSAVRKYSLNIVNRDSVITLSQLEPKAGVMGSAWIARMKMFEK